LDQEIADPLARGVEAPQGGGNFRYTVRYDDERGAAGWGFRMVLAKLPLMDDGQPAGIITALPYDSEPSRYP